MDFINWLQQQKKMYDPHVNAQNLLGGVSTAVANNVNQQANTPGGYVPGGADLTGNTQALIDPDKLNPGGYVDNTLPPLQQTTPETNTYGVADLTNDYTHDLTRPVNESRYSPTNTNIVPSLLTTRQEDKSPERIINDVANQAVLDNGQRIGQEPVFKVPSKIEQQALENPSLLAIQPLLDRYGGNMDMALIAKKMSPELMDALLAQYGVKWKDNLAEHLKQFLIDNNAY